MLVGDVITLVFTALLESQGWDLENVAREQLGMLSLQVKKDYDPDNPAPVNLVWALHKTSMGWLLYINSLPTRLGMWAFTTSLVGISHRQRSQSGSVLCHASVEAEQDGGRGQDGGYNAGGQLGALGAGHCQ